MDTIFVKSVREDGPAHQAGLRTGEQGHGGAGGQGASRLLGDTRHALPGSLLLVLLFILHYLFSCPLSPCSEQSWGPHGLGWLWGPHRT